MLAPTPEIAARRSPFHRTAWFALVLFCLGHFSVDLYSGSLGVFQPLLVDRFGLSFTEAGILAGLLVCSSSVMQPVYGLLSDRFHTRLFAALGPAMAGVFIGLLGVAPRYWVLLVLVWLGGMGMAAFHPQAAANAVAHIKENRGRAMAIFLCAGTAGLALGPAFFSALLDRGGLRGAAWGMLPGLLVSGILLAWLPLPAEAARPRARFDWASLRAVWRPMLLLYLLVFIRSIVQQVFTQFLPLYLHDQRGYSLTHASLSLTTYLMGGAIGGLVGGNLADRFGGRRIIVVSMIGSVPLLALFVFTTGMLSAAALVLGGMVLLFTIPINVVMAQDLAPSQAGTVSALMMGFGWGMAGFIFIPLTGWFSDLFSIERAFAVLILFPLLGFLLALKLPRDLDRRAAA